MKKFKNHVHPVNPVNLKMLFPLSFARLSYISSTPPI